MNIVETIQIIGKVIVVLRNVKTGEKKIIHGINIVTDKGDKYYAQSVCGEIPDDDFDGANSGLRLGSDNTPPKKSDNDVTTFLAESAQALDAGYPKTNDNDLENSGKGVNIVSWRYSYGNDEGNVNGIIEGAIVDDRINPSGALTHFLFDEMFGKSFIVTMEVFVNAVFNGI